jgi:hypothetical protein
MEIYYALQAYMIAHIAVVFWLIIITAFCSVTGGFLPTPLKESPLWYVILFAVMHGLSADAGRLWYVLVMPWLRRHGLTDAEHNDPPQKAA